MKKQTMYNRLQKQYEKLNQSIQKAMKTGRFYAYTQFKQEQLLSRLKRCSFQLKQLGAGVAVVAALGMATPAVGQYVPPSFIIPQGSDNPCAPITGGITKFVDIDDDGDMDCFVSYYDNSDYTIKYYENTGTINSAVYIQRTGVANPLDALIDEENISFVDIDNDGDMDCFASAFYYKNNKTLSYYENTGDSINPVFTLQLPVDNPLNTVVTTYGLGNKAWTSFVDMDSDGDMDCFVGLTDDIYTSAISNMLYYENTGSTTAPIFTLQTGTANPLSLVDTAIVLLAHLEANFVDMDKDGDLDAFVNSNFKAASITGSRFKNAYYENIGDAINPIFTDTSTVTPIDGFGSVAVRRTTYLTPVDLDGDTDLDFVVAFNVGGSNPVIFYENQDSVLFSNIFKIEEDNLESLVYPNPTSKILNFDQVIEGTVRVYTISCQLALTKELQNEQELDITMLNNGIYFLEVETKKGRIREKIIVQK